MGFANICCLLFDSFFCGDFIGDVDCFWSTNNFVESIFDCGGSGHLSIISLDADLILEVSSSLGL